MQQITRIIAAAACTICMGGAANGADAEHRLTFASAYPASSLIGAAAEEFIDLAEEKTEGSVVITPHFGGALGYDSRAQYTAVEQGAVDLGQYPFDNLVGL